MKMKSSMKLKAIMIITMLGMSLAGYTQAQKKDGTFASESGMEMQVDSMVYKNESRPVYYARYGNRGCLFELRINDNVSAEVTEPVNIGETSITINPVIFKSGKQSISINLKPFPGRKTIMNEKPFRLEIGYYDFTEKLDSMGNRIWHKVFELPEIEIPEEGLSQIKIEKEFEAQVPYEITTWDEYVDLREIPNIEQKVVEEYNKEHDIDNSVLVNGRRQTNLGVFRAYLTNYLRSLPTVNQDMTCMVRQLQPTETGIPLELYFFSANKVWVAYEGIQADVFDHVLAIIPEFGLRVFQNPSGEDLRRIGVKIEH